MNYYYGNTIGVSEHCKTKTDKYQKLFGIQAQSFNYIAEEAEYKYFHSERKIKINKN